MHLNIKQPNQKTKRLILQDAHYVPDLICNLFSLTCYMSNDAEISFSGLEPTIKKGSLKIIFDQVIKSANGHLLAIKALQMLNIELYKTQEAVIPTITKSVKTSKNQLSSC